MPPPRQNELDASYRRELKSGYNIVFSELHTITNLPINRFLDELLKADKLDEYLQILIDNFNPLTAQGVMCRTMLSVDCQGAVLKTGVAE